MTISHMSSKDDFDHVKIDITYLNKNKLKRALKLNKKLKEVEEFKEKMCDHACKNKHRFLCTLCLNETVLDGSNERLQNGCAYCPNKQLMTCKADNSSPRKHMKCKHSNGHENETKNTRNDLKNKSDNEIVKNEGKSKRYCKTCDEHGKEVKNVDGKNGNVNKNAEDELDKQITAARKSIATGIDLKKSLDLLNEVLNVFQSNKAKQCCKDTTIVSKDACTATEGGIIKNDAQKPKPQLCISKVVYYSVRNENWEQQSKFVLLESRQPEIVKSHFNLRKHKSSSIPQMKLEELKYSLKEKTKSKDAIEEVNRMFATVKKYERDDREESETNRPMVRHGPRVLPVVRANTHAQRDLCDNYSDASSRRCHNCQVNDYNMSGGDFAKANRCQELSTKHDKTVVMLACKRDRSCADAPAPVICQCCHAACDDDDLQLVD